MRALLMLMMSIAGCSTISAYQAPRYAFSPPLADADVKFEVIDRRTEASKRFSALETHPPSYRYADEQLGRGPVRAIATYFAAAFPQPAVGTQLIIDQFDLIDQIARPTGNQPTTASNIGDVLGITAMKALQGPEPNTVTCRVVGSFANHPFHAMKRATYERPGSTEHSNAVVGAMLAAISTAIETVKKDR